MALTPSSRIGPYEVLSPLGAGGMGEVFLARDPRLGREVAIKALPDAFAHDPDRLARFEREARVLASLKHPNIATIYGLEESDGQRYLILEYVPGPTLADRLASGPLPLDETLDVCAQIAAGVEAAHESGVVHRDLKPANVKLTPAGEVKVLDFGLAKGAGGSNNSSGLDLSNSPTLAHQATTAGVILGTAAYMSPEQARGRPVDRRTDIWSFGCVLYQCLTGRPLYEGDTVSDLIARILEREPDWSALPAATPASVRELLARCLRKDARERQRDIGDVRLELAEIRARRPDPPAAAASPVRSAGSARLAWILAGVLAILTAAAYLMPRGTSAPVTRMTVLTPDLDSRVQLGDYAMAPDGHAVAFAQLDSAGIARLFVRDLNRVDARLIAGTEDASCPCWSPDSRDLGFFAQGRLRRVPAAGGAVRALCDAPVGRGTAWGNGQIVFAPTARSPLFAVDDEGGTPRAVTLLDTTRHDISHRFPSMAPDGRHFVFTVQTQTSGTGTVPACAASLSDPHARFLFEVSSAPVFAGSDRLLFTHDRALLVQRIDPGSLKPVGRPTVLEEPLNTNADIAQSPAVSCSRNGAMVYVPADQRPRELVWITPDGRTASTGLRTEASSGLSQLSPDGTRLALLGYEPTGFSLSIADLGQRRLTQIAPMGRGLYFPVWSADGTQLAGNNAGSSTNLVTIDPVSGADSVLNVGRAAWRVASAWTPARDAILYEELTPERKYDIGYFTFADAKAHTYLSTSANEGAAVPSHDGRWVAYLSDASGRAEVFVDGFPRHTGAQRVGGSSNSSHGAPTIWWRRDDRELYFGGPDPSSIYAVSVQATPRLTFSPPRLVMKLPTTAGYDFAPELGRAIALVPVGSQPAAFTVVQGWAKEPVAKR